VDDYFVILVCSLSLSYVSMYNDNSCCRKQRRHIRIHCIHCTCFDIH